MNFTKRFISLLSFSVTLLFFSCQKEIDISREYPRLEVVLIEDISENGATFIANVISKGNSDIIEHGFVWGQEDKNLSIVQSERITFGSFKGVGAYKATTSFGLEKNKNYFVKAYAKTESHIVYSIAKVFYSLGCEPPIINSFYPKSAGWGDSIRISGKNFGFETTKLVLTIDNVASHIIYASDSLIIGSVPINTNLDPTRLSLNVYGRSVFSEDNFTFIMPQVSFITPSLGTFKDTISIIGTNFPVDLYQFSVKFDNIIAEIVSVSKSEIKVKVPLTISNPYPSVSVQLSGMSFVLANSFSLKPPFVLSVSPENLFGSSRIISISGDFFNPEPSLNKIKLGEYQVEVMSASKTEILARTPYDLSNGIYNLTINTGCFTLSPNQAITFTNPWFQISDMGGVARWRAVAFEINGKGYVGTGLASYSYNELNDFWEYIPETSTWIQKADFPGVARKNALGFSVGNFGYIGPSGSDNSSSNKKDMWEFSQATNTWIQKENYPGEVVNEQPVGYSMTNEGYFFVGNFTKDMWLYDPINDLWSQKSSNPAHGHRYNAAGFIIDGKIYICNGLDAYTQTLKDELWEFDPDNNRWTKKARFPGGGRNGSIGFALNGKGYVGLGRNISGSLSNDLWEYDPSTDSWSRTFDFPGGGRRNAVGFQIGNKAYIGTGLGTSNIVKKDFWEFDPNRL